LAISNGKDYVNATRISEGLSWNGKKGQKPLRSQKIGREPIKKVRKALRGGGQGVPSSERYMPWEGAESSKTRSETGKKRSHRKGNGGALHP